MTILDTLAVVLFGVVFAVMALSIIRLERRIRDLEDNGMSIDVGIMDIPLDSDAGRELIERMKEHRDD